MFCNVRYYACIFCLVTLLSVCIMLCDVWYACVFCLLRALDSIFICFSVYFAVMALDVSVTGLEFLRLPHAIWLI